MIVALALAAAAASDTAQYPVLSVSELVGREAEFHGRIVEVHGWMGECRPLGCFIHATPDGVGKRALDADHRQWLSIGPAKAGFDRKAAQLKGRQVGLRARFDETCLDQTMICLDRVSELRPINSHPLFALKDH